MPASAPDGVLGFDTDTALTAHAAATLFAEGYRFAIRYVSRSAAADAGDLTATEANLLLQAGLALMPVQHVRAQGWTPSRELGVSDGLAAAYHAFCIGFPAGVNVWCDLEGIASPIDPQEVIDYAKAWFATVAATPYLPGLYVGAGSILTANTLGFQLPFEHYWKSMSQVPEPAGRGYQMVQSATTTVAGIAIDPDRTGTDQRGGQVQWLSPATVSTRAVPSRPSVTAD